MAIHTSHDQAQARLIDDSIARFAAATGDTAELAGIAIDGVPVLRTTRTLTAAEKAAASAAGFQNAKWKTGSGRDGATYATGWHG